MADSTRDDDEDSECIVHAARPAIRFIEVDIGPAEREVSVAAPATRTCVVGGEHNFLRPRTWTDSSRHWPSSVHFLECGAEINPIDRRDPINHRIISAPSLADTSKKADCEVEVYEVDR